MSRSPSPRGRAGSRDRDGSRGRADSRDRGDDRADFDSEKLQFGTCKWFNNEKGFGFISPDDGSESIFVHQSQIHARGFRSLAEGEKVEYKMTQESDGRYKAIQVTGPDGDHCKGQPRDDYGDRGGRGDRRGGRDRDRGGYGDRDRGRDRGYDDRRGGDRGYERRERY